MRVSRLREEPRRLQAFDRAKLSRPTLLLLVVLRCYAIVAVAIAIYAFFHAVV